MNSPRRLSTSQRALGITRLLVRYVSGSRKYKLISIEDEWFILPKLGNPAPSYPTYFAMSFPEALDSLIWLEDEHAVPA